MTDLRTTLALIKAHSKYPNPQLLAYFEQAEQQVKAIELKVTALEELLKGELIHAARRGSYKKRN